MSPSGIDFKFHLIMDVMQGHFDLENIPLNRETNLYRNPRFVTIDCYHSFWIEVYGIIVWYHWLKKYQWNIEIQKCTYKKVIVVHFGCTIRFGCKKSVIGFMLTLGFIVPLQVNLVHLNPIFICYFNFLDYTLKVFRPHLTWQVCLCFLSSPIAPVTPQDVVSYPMQS